MLYSHVSGISKKVGTRMGVRIDISLDVDGNHRFVWVACDDPRALHVPEALLRRWSAERVAFSKAAAHWQSVVQEIEDYLYSSAPAPALAHSPPLAYSHSLWGQEKSQSQVNPETG